MKTPQIYGKSMADPIWTVDNEKSKKPDSNLDFGCPRTSSMTIHHAVSTFKF
jgi:hypothetical protein